MPSLPTVPHPSCLASRADGADADGAHHAGAAAGGHAAAVCRWGGAGRQQVSSSWRRAAGGGDAPRERGCRARVSTASPLDPPLCLPLQCLSWRPPPPPPPPPAVKLESTMKSLSGEPELQAEDKAALINFVSLFDGE